MQITGEQVFSTLVSLDQIPEGTEHELVVQAKCHVIVAVVGSAFDALQVLDADGKQWPIGLVGGFSTGELPLQAGKTMNVTFPESVTTVLLFRDGVEIERQSVMLQCDKTTTLEF